MNMLEDKETVLADICQRLSLRPPQKESLERLAEAVEAAGLVKGADEAALDAQLAVQERTRLAFQCLQRIFRDGTRTATT